MRPVAVYSCLAILTSVLLVPVLAKRIKQPIQYSHKKHVQELEIDCLECHKYAKSMARAWIPNIDVCQDCHDEQITESPEEKKLIEYIANSELIPWQKIYRVPSHVYFSHRRHTILGGLDCTACHGEVQEMEKPFSNTRLSMSMNRCMECHEEQGVNNDCTRCHR